MKTKIFLTLLSLINIGCAAQQLKTEPRSYRFGQTVQLIGFYDGCTGVIISKADPITYMSEVECPVSTNAYKRTLVYIQLTDIKQDGAL